MIGEQSFRFYSEEMTDTKLIALAHFEKELSSVSNSVNYLDWKYKEFKVPKTA